MTVTSARVGGENNERGTKEIRDTEIFILLDGFRV